MLIAAVPAPARLPTRLVAAWLPIRLTIDTSISLSPAAEPIPSKLVDKIRSGQFIEIRELLTDNIALLQQMDSLKMPGIPFPILPGALKPHWREVSTLPSWLYCFLAYVAILAPDRGKRDMLAYARLIIREAQRHGGMGWLDYDRIFRQQAAAIRWNTLHPAIQGSTMVGQAPRPNTFCTLCHEVDHSVCVVLPSSCNPSF